MSKSFFRGISLLLSLSLLAGCAGTQNSSRDPLEPMNRVVYQFNDKADRWVIKPVAQTYHNYTPHLVIKSISNFFNNLNSANSALNYALQGNGKASLYSLSRFTVNSTVGLLGLIDITAGNTAPYEQTGFGDTLANWGWKNSAYLVIPITGPSSLRDGTGLLADVTFRENTLYSNPHEDAKQLSNVVNGIEIRERMLGLEDTIDDAALDPYTYVRDAYLQIRAKKTGDKLPKTEAEEDFNIDDLME